MLMLVGQKLTPNIAYRIHGNIFCARSIQAPSPYCTQKGHFYHMTLLLFSG